MTNLQFYVAIGGPTPVIIAGTIVNSILIRRATAAITQTQPGALVPRPANGQQPPPKA